MLYNDFVAGNGVAGVNKSQVQGSIDMCADAGWPKTLYYLGNGKTSLTNPANASGNANANAPTATPTLGSLLGTAITGIISGSKVGNAPSASGGAPADSEKIPDYNAKLDKAACVALMKKIDVRKDLDIDTSSMTDCVRMGVAPSRKNLPSKGYNDQVKGVSHTTVTAPEDGPGPRNAKASIDRSTILFNCSFPPSINKSGLSSLLGKVTGIGNAIGGLGGSAAGLAGGLGGSIGSIGSNASNIGSYLTGPGDDQSLASAVNSVQNIKSTVGQIAGTVSSLKGTFNQIKGSVSSLAGGVGAFKPGSCANFVQGLFKDKNDNDVSSTPSSVVSAAIAADNVNASCPVASDTTGTFGVVAALTANPPPSLVCGGAIPLSTDQLTLNANASDMASTQNGSFYLWHYQKDSSNPQALNYKQLNNGPVKLPSYFGTKDPLTGTCSVTTTLLPPISQIITFNAAATRLKIRLQQLSEDDPNFDPDAPEKYLIIPVQNGIPQIPGDCEDEASYYQPITASDDDLVIEAAATPACTGALCSAATSAPTIDTSCDVVTLYPNATVQTAAGTVDCTTKTQMLVVDRPTLVYPSGTTPMLTPIETRTGLLAASVPGTSLYMNYDTVVTMGRSAPPFTLPQGGSMEMADGSRLQMAGPATVNAAGGSVSMVNGGKLMGVDGSTIQQFSNGATFTPSNPLMPYTIHVGRNIDLPVNFQVPTQASPYVRLPIDAP